MLNVQFNHVLVRKFEMRFQFFYENLALGGKERQR